uniref:Transporter n=1 Tax=Macrostomum lignano TaxID=282301 RepID=A0A1I8INB2_9PLAT
MQKLRSLLARFSRQQDGFSDLQQQQQHQRPHGQQQRRRRSSRRYSATSSGGRQVFATAASKDSVDGSSSSVHRETPTQMRDRQIRELRAQLAPKEPLQGLGNFTAAASAGEAPVNYSVDENPERGNWSGRLDFLLSCLGYAVGLGNVWRFPYLCFINGGGAFFVPYIIFLLLCGVPVFLLDLSLGQFTPARARPPAGRVGYAMTYLSTIVGIYYNMIIAISIYYLFASMNSDLPWSSCDNAWNTPLCSSRLPLVTCNLSDQQLNGTCYNGTKLLGLYNESLFTQVTKLHRILPADEYFNHEVLKTSSDINKFGSPDWKLVLCLLLSWIVIYCCMVKGIKSSGKVVYFTALFPYVVLLILFFRGVTLENAIEGIRFYIVPDFSALGKARVWKDAAGQIFFSLSCSWGGLMSLSSYNRFHNNVIRDTFFVTSANCLTSVFAGFVIFSFIGHLAGNLKVPVKDVSQSGFGLAFIIYPEAMKLLPGSTFWAILFFFMILNLGVDSQFAMVETLITSLCDQFRGLRRHKPPVIAVVSVVMFLLGLPFTCSGGLYLMNIVDSYAGSWTILLIGFFECVTVGWVYGRPGFGNFHRFSEDIGLIMQRPISPIWRYLWQYISPALIMAIIIFNWVDYGRSEYTAGAGDFYPGWADALGWLIAIAT